MKSLKFLLRNFYRPKRLLWYFWLKSVKPSFIKYEVQESHLTIDVLILAVEKDLDTLPYAIDSVKRNVLHPIGDIFVIAPPSEAIQAVCVQKNCILIDENNVLPITKKDIDYIPHPSYDRSGWLFQQFLKWSEDIGNNTHYLVIDADTVFIRPQVFERDGRVIFNCSDEYHLPYFKIYRQLLQENSQCPLSFTSHHMLFERQKLKELKKRIEDVTGYIWYEAILHNLDKTQGAGHSDYETYGQYVFAHYREDIALEYWFNLMLKRSAIVDIDNLERDYRNQYKSLSFHHHNQ